MGYIRIGRNDDGAKLACGAGLPGFDAPETKYGINKFATGDPNPVTRSYPGPAKYPL